MEIDKMEVAKMEVAKMKVEWSEMEILRSKWKRHGAKLLLQGVALCEQGWVNQRKEIGKYH